MSSSEQGVSPEFAEWRRASKLSPPMHCYWGSTEACTRSGRVTSLGPDGCFVKTKAEAGEDQSLFLNCWLPTERWLMLRARVTYRLARVGFGLVFTHLSAAEREMLWALLAYLDAAQTARAAQTPGFGPLAGP